MRQDQAPAPPRTSPSSLWQPGIGGRGAGQRRGRAPFIPCRCSCCCSPVLSLEQSGSQPLERSAERAHHEARYGRGYRATSTGVLGGPNPLYLLQSVVGSGQLSLYPETRAGVPAFRESVRESSRAQVCEHAGGHPAPSLRQGAGRGTSSIPLLGRGKQDRRGQQPGVRSTGHLV